MKKTDNTFYMVLAVIDCMDAMTKNDFDALNFHKRSVINFYSREFKAVYTAKQFPTLLTEYKYINISSHDFYKTVHYLAHVIFWRESHTAFCVE